MLVKENRTQISRQCKFGRFRKGQIPGSPVFKEWRAMHRGVEPKGIVWRPEVH
jgi:hypothetical protein